jgi:inorganic pyrophosphatase
MHYPGDYGFIPGTIAEDGEPLDVLCLVTSPSFSGCVSDVRPVAVLDMLDSDEVDHKVLAVPNRDPRYNNIQSLAEIDCHVQREIEHFFQIYKDLEGHPMRTRGWRDAKETAEVITTSRKHYLDSSPKRPGGHIIGDQRE